jgi:hypothetical protein
LNGRIRGRVVGRDGKPAPDLELQITLMNPTRIYGGIDKRYTARTDENGEYEFRAIPPGTYLLGHRIIEPDFRFGSPGQVQPSKTYYPGTPDRAGAIPIVVGNATQHGGLDFVVVW